MTDIKEVLEGQIRTPRAETSSCADLWCNEGARCYAACSLYQTPKQIDSKGSLNPSQGQSITIHKLCSTCNICSLIRTSVINWCGILHQEYKMRVIVLPVCGKHELWVLEFTFLASDYEFKRCNLHNISILLSKWNILQFSLYLSVKSWRVNIYKRFAHCDQILTSRPMFVYTEHAAS